MKRDEERIRGAPEAGNARKASYQAEINRALWPIILFLAISVWARADFAFFPRLPEDWRVAMGSPPPPYLVSAAFVIYLLAAIIKTLVKMASEGPPGRGFDHVGYLTGFYIFFNLSGILDSSYWAIVVGGLVILTAEGYRNMLYYKKLRKQH
ncbi:MAG: hypothetical protein C0609_07610 [Deltaproteobacteria bacterium]|nr:MAG: hypothetical protein C0609_07610 [Deltaproteobacteria bacterium]